MFAVFKQVFIQNKTKLKGIPSCQIWVFQENSQNQDIDTKVTDDAEEPFQNYFVNFFSSVRCFECLNIQEEYGKQK